MDGNNYINNDRYKNQGSQDDLALQPVQQSQQGTMPTATRTQTYTPPRMQPQYGQMQPMAPTTVYPLPGSMETKYCKFCAAVIPIDAVICTACGRQVEALAGSQQQQQNPQVINIQNTNTNTNVNPNVNMGGPMMVYGHPKDKVVAILLCLFTGWFGGHKFYEGKILMGILYLFTAGLCGVGVLVDLIILLTKPNPYYV